MQEEINSLKLELITAQNKLQESEKEKRNIEMSTRNEVSNGY